MPTMTPDQERWGEAMALLRIHGDQAEAYVAERIRWLAAISDPRGVERFEQIGARLAQLIERGSVQ